MKEKWRKTKNVNVSAESMHNLTLVAAVTMRKKTVVETFIVVKRIEYRWLWMLIIPVLRRWNQEDLGLRVA